MSISSIPDSVGKKLIGLVTSREEIPNLLKLDDVIDLVIPRGSNKLVSQIKDSTKIPVLGHAEQCLHLELKIQHLLSDGICHVYVDKSANMDTAKHIVLDAKVDYPAACNAMFVRKAVSRLGKAVSRIGGGPLRMILQDCRTVEFPENVESNPSKFAVKWWDDEVLELLDMEIEAFLVSCCFKSCEDNFIWVLYAVYVLVDGSGRWKKVCGKVILDSPNAFMEGRKFLNATLMANQAVNSGFRSVEEIFYLAVANSLEVLATLTLLKSFSSLPIFFMSLFIILRVVVTIKLKKISWDLLLLELEICPREGSFVETCDYEKIWRGLGRVVFSSKEGSFRVELWKLMRRVWDAFEETLLVHKDLVQTGGLNQLIVELRNEGGAFCINKELLFYL
ncbi:Delta-1-pyrroline-5-carboxylate synthase [Vitis vinifera]|uniref:Delta-1-pyrroline-5-carboxylate synthase n=1 Tax=Vitis vinifera TaxID=29760 RepID=A0A438ENJ8_VITVI|nr:Delta-1-pyrroline-5-carboxylate synthase [Vitis vinifera]